MSQVALTKTIRFFNEKCKMKIEKLKNLNHSGLSTQNPEPLYLDP
jgi:hypothetical protein